MLMSIDVMMIHVDVVVLHLDVLYCYGIGHVTGIDLP
jgi:hypothetical protein